MDDLRSPLAGGKRRAKSARNEPHRPPALAAAPANDGPALDAATESALDAALAATVPLLRAAMRRELAARLPYLQHRPRRERVGRRPGDDAPVDPLTRAKARALLEQHAPRGGR